MSGTERRRIRNTTSAPASARRYVGSLLGDAPADVVGAVSVMVSELTTNCVRYAPQSDITVSVEDRGVEVRVDVADDDEGQVSLRTPDRDSSFGARPLDPAGPSPGDLDGLGLRIVENLSDEWGVSESADQRGKSVWFTVRLGRRR